MIQMFTPNYGFCLSADIKPSPGVHGTMLQEIDTGKTYLCIASGWLELTNIAVINITRLEIKLSEAADLGCILWRAL